MPNACWDDLESSIRITRPLSPIIKHGIKQYGGSAAAVKAPKDKEHNLGNFCKNFFIFAIIAIALILFTIWIADIK